MADQECHKHHLSSMLNLIASLNDPAENEIGAGTNQGQFKDNFGNLILSSLPEQQTDGSPSSSYLHALSALSKDTGLGGLHLQDELPAAVDDLHLREAALVHDGRRRLLGAERAVVARDENAGHAVGELLADLREKVGVHVDRAVLVHGGELREESEGRKRRRGWVSENASSVKRGFHR